MNSCCIAVVIPSNGKRGEHFRPKRSVDFFLRLQVFIQVHRLRIDHIAAALGRIGQVELHAEIAVVHVFNADLLPNFHVVVDLQVGDLAEVFHAGQGLDLHVHVGGGRRLKLVAVRINKRDIQRSKAGHVQLFLFDALRQLVRDPGLQGLVVALAAFLELGHAQSGAFGDLGIRAVGDADGVTGAVGGQVFGLDHEGEHGEAVSAEIESKAVRLEGRSGLRGGFHQLRGGFHQLRGGLDRRGSSFLGHVDGLRHLTLHFDRIFMDMGQLDGAGVVQADGVQLHVHRRQGLDFFAFRVHEGDVRRLDGHGLHFHARRQGIEDSFFFDRFHLQLRAIGQGAGRGGDLHADVSRDALELEGLRVRDSH